MANSTRTIPLGLESATAELEAFAQTGLLADEIPAGLRRTRDALDAHCAEMEGDGGGFDQILRADPRLRRRIDGLRFEHLAARHEIDTLLDLADRAPSLHHPTVMLPLITRVRALVAAIRDHHDHLSAAVHEAFVVDVGSVD